MYCMYYYHRLAKELLLSSYLLPLLSIQKIKTVGQKLVEMMSSKLVICVHSPAIVLYFVWMNIDLQIWPRVRERKFCCQSPPETALVLPAGCSPWQGKGNMVLATVYCNVQPPALGTGTDNCRYHFNKLIWSICVVTNVSPVKLIIEVIFTFNLCVVLHLLCNITPIGTGRNMVQAGW